MRQLSGRIHSLAMIWKQNKFTKSLSYTRIMLLSLQSTDTFKGDVITILSQQASACSNGTELY